MNKLIIPLAIGIAILALIGFVYLQRRTAELETLPLPAGADGQPPAVVAEEEPVIRYPLPEVDAPPKASAQDVDEDVDEAPTAGVNTVAPPDALDSQADESPAPLPPLDKSDAQFKSAISAFVTERSLETLFRTDGFIRRLVVSIDNLPGMQLPRAKHRAMRPIAGRFVVRAEGDSLYLSPDNFERYTPIVELIASLDVDRLIAVYLRYYPLFQEAYEYLGYPSAYFNDRLIDVIDHLLAAPAVDGPVKLVRPHVLYRYGDPNLETLSAGRKVMIRVGPVNARKLKSKLREIRHALTGEAEAEELSKEIETGIDLLLDENAEKSAP